MFSVAFKETLYYVVFKPDITSSFNVHVQNLSRTDFQP